MRLWTRHYGMPGVISIQQPASNCVKESHSLRKSTGVDESWPAKILRLVEASNYYVK